ncbi:TetR/AcrR family transcriptional regulator [Aidingimonas lacisalsi]|uniref:TetR/AcrR family transcriptional regulator n=1 Tax=Aidingimonas lacisalsi TaxID=2604086 RepID=UPI0011D25E19|nr:TetR/AcrR family transcriptional regulator [Aidingimonas lacisalsi]
MTMIPVHHDVETESASLASRILDMALLMAEERGWKAVTLSGVARRLNVPPRAVLDAYRDLDAVANAWFLHGWHAMLADKPDGFDDWSAKDRIRHCLLAWFDAMAVHRRVTVQMLCTKMHPPHVHTWVPMMFDLSRTIQWLRETARLEAPYGSRQAQGEEIALTALFLDTLRYWARDESSDQAETRRFLNRRLAYGDRLMRCLRCDGNKRQRESSAVW